MDCSLPRSSVHGIFQARVLGWVAISFSKGSSRPRDRTRISLTVSTRFTVWATREVLPLKTSLVKRTECSVFQSGCIFPLPIRSSTGCFTFSLFSQRTWLGFWSKSYKNVRTLLTPKPPPHPAPHPVFILQACPVIWQTPLEWSYQDWLPQWTPTPGKPVSLTLGVMCWLQFSMYLKTLLLFSCPAVGFFFFFFFFGWENEREDFEVLVISDWKHSGRLLFKF